MPFFMSLTMFCFYNIINKMIIRETVQTAGEKMDKKIYVLVPVYNVERYLKDCVDSIIGQTYTNWELILVDDGSTDSSGKICDEYAQKDKRIRVVHQENRGLFGARRTGVASIVDVSDTYCTFCDSDDMFPENAFEILIKTAENENCDIVCGTSQKFLNLKKPVLSGSNSDILNPSVYADRDIFDKLYNGNFGYGSFPVSFWAKLFKTEIIKTAFSQIDRWPHFFGEDLNANLRILPLAKKVAVIDNAVYFYRYGGGTNKFMKTYVDDCILLYHEKKEYAVKYDMNPYYIMLIDVEMKNLAAQYLIMCIRSKTYPHGMFKDEIGYILNIPEFYNATCAITDEVLARDYSEIPGFTGAFVKKDVNAIEEIIKKKANEGKLKRFIKNLL